jgi:hypothetical protein
MRRFRAESSERAVGREYQTDFRFRRIFAADKTENDRAPSAFEKGSRGESEQSSFGVYAQMSRAKRYVGPRIRFNRGKKFKF